MDHLLEYLRYNSSPVFYAYHVAYQSSFWVVWKQTGQATNVSVDVIPYVSKGTLSVVRDRR